MSAFNDSNNNNSMTGIIHQIMVYNTSQTIEKNNEYIKKLEKENNEYIKKMETALEYAKTVGEQRNKNIKDSVTAAKLMYNSFLQDKVLEKFMKDKNITNEHIKLLCPELDKILNLAEQGEEDEDHSEDHSEDQQEVRGRTNIELDSEEEDENEEIDESNLFTREFIQSVDKALSDKMKEKKIDSKKITETMLRNKFEKDVSDNLEKLEKSGNGIFTDTKVSGKSKVKDQSTKVRSNSSVEDESYEESNLPLITILTEEQARLFLKQHLIILSTISRNIFARTCEFNYAQLYYDKTIQNKLNEYNIIICDEEDIGKDLEYVAKKYEKKKKYHEDKAYQAILNTSLPSNQNYNKGYKSTSPVFYTYYNTNDIRKSNCNSCNNAPSNYIKTQSFGNTTFKSSNVC